MSLKPILAALKNNLFTILIMVVGLFWTLTVVFAETWGNERWQTKADAAAQSAVVTPLPMKVEKLETWQASQMAAQLHDNAQFDALLEKMTAMQINQAEGNAIMAELVKSNDRVLRRLDNAKP